MLKRGEQAAAHRAELEEIKKERQEFRKEPSVIAKAKLRLEVAPLLYAEEPEGDKEKNKDKVRLDSLKGIIEFHLSLPDRPSVDIYDQALDDLADIIVDKEGGKKKKVQNELEVIAENADVKKWVETEVDKAFAKWAPRVMDEFEIAVREAYGSVELVDDVATQVNRFSEMASNAIDGVPFVKERVKTFEQGLRKEFRSKDRQWKIVESEMGERDQDEMRRVLDEPSIMTFIEQVEELKPLLKHAASEEVQRAWGILVINRIEKDLGLIAKIQENKDRYRSDVDAERVEFRREFRRKLYVKRMKKEEFSEEEKANYEQQMGELKRECRLRSSCHYGARMFFSKSPVEMQERLKGTLSDYAVRSGMDFDQIWQSFVDQVVEANEKRYRYHWLLSTGWFKNSKEKEVDKLLAKAS